MLCREAREPIRTVASKPDTECEPQRMGNGRGNPACPYGIVRGSPLDRVQIAKMVRELSAHHALPRDIVEGVSERTGGVPLFIEEVTRLLLERGEQGGAQAIPPTLQQSLAARLDRLGSAREAAQIGAVRGRGFSYALLQSVAGLDEGALPASAVASSSIRSMST
jgi:predicted ATPase